jgi:hypothetical protein
MEAKNHGFIFDLSKKQMTLDKYVKSSPSQEIRHNAKEFICIVPFYDFEHH